MNKNFSHKQAAKISLHTDQRLRLCNPALTMLLVIAAIQLFSLPASAQTSATAPQAGNVSLSGTVTDQTGAVIPGAKVRLKRKGEEESVKVKSDEAGRFSFAEVPPGTYKLKVEADNFAEVEKELRIVAGQPLPAQHIELAVGGQGETVTVSGSGRDAEETISLTRNADRISFAEDMLNDLPAPGQDPLAYIASFMSPAAQGGEGAAVSVEGSESSGANLPSGAIRRVRINRNPYSAENRRPGKSRVEVLTEEGSFNRYRGRLSVYARNSVFDARNPFARTRPDLDRKVVEMNIGGPLVGKRIAFFVSGERYLSDETEIVNAATLNGPLVNNVLTPERHSNVLGRLDWQGSERHSGVLLYSFSEENQRNRGVGGLRLPAQGISTAEREHRVQAQYRLVVPAGLINTLRFVAERETERAGLAATAPVIAVNGAFIGGPSSLLRQNRKRTFRLDDTVTVTRGRHELRFGAETKFRHITAEDATNFNGTYEFASLDQFAAQTPFVFRINQGQPAVSFIQREAYVFVQDEIQLRQNLTVTPGVRYGWQTNLRDHNNLAPRLAIAWAAPDNQTIVRAGAGLFYERLSESVIQRSLLSDGLRIRELVITQPAYPDPFAGAAGTLPPPSVVRIASDIRAPYVTQASLSVERELWRRTLMTVEYETLRGVHLLRSRNLNAPLPVGVGSGQRPDLSFLNISQVESSAQSRSNALSVTVRGNLTRWFQSFAQYTLSRTSDNTNGLFGLPANNYDLGPEWGRADFDQRHRFSLAGTLEAPLGFRFGTIVSLASGIPFDITTGSDDNGDTVANDRPAGVTRNTGEGPGLARIDLRVSKRFRVPRIIDRQQEHRSQNIEFRVDFFNLFNRVNFENFVGVQSSPFFGQAVAAHRARMMQLSMRYKF